MKDAQQVKLSLLGRTLATRADGTPLRFPTRHAILALAVLSSGKLRRDELAAILWPEASPESRAKRLRSLLPHLRRALGPNLCEVDDQVSIVPGSIVADAWQMTNHADYAGDFMPRLDQDWVIDRRLELRESACQSAVDEASAAWSAGREPEALRLIARAVEIDPLHEQANELRIAWLEQAGHRSQSIRIADEHRRRVLHDLGTLPAAREPQAPTQTHPLVTAANWLLDSNPHDLAPMLIATQNEWLSLPVQQALDIHERALIWISENDGSTKKIVEAQRIGLMVQAGQLHQNMPAAEQALIEAEAAGEVKIAAHLAMALSYGCLSNGDFLRAIRFGKRSVTAADKTSDPVTKWSCKYNLAIIQGHSGEPDSSNAKTVDFASRADDSPSELLRAGVLISSIDAQLAVGNTEAACRQLELGRRIFSMLGPHRHEAWILISEARLHSAIGDYSAARESLETASKIGWRIAGHSAMAMASDQLGKTWCMLGQYDLAVQSVARSRRLRTHFRTVPSLCERPVIEQTHVALRENLGETKARLALGQ